MTTLDATQRAELVQYIEESRKHLNCLLARATYAGLVVGVDTDWITTFGKPRTPRIQIEILLPLTPGQNP